MKGHTRTVSALVTVTNGLPAPTTVSGVVKDESGNPLEGAIVNNFKAGLWYGHTNFAGSSVTAADGKFQITVPRTNFTYTFSVLYKGYAFTCNYSGGTVGVNAANIPNVIFTRTPLMRTLSCWISGTPIADSNLWVSDGSQSVPFVNWGAQLSVADGSLVTLTATSTNPTYIISSDFPKPYRVVDNADLTFFVSNPGVDVPRAAFAANGTNSDDTVGTVTIPVTMTLPAGLTNWPADQWFSYTIDDSSTAEYGVDYKAHGGLINFYNNKPPWPYLIPLTVFHDAIPKLKTVVIKLAPASSVVNLGSITTFTYTIHNAPYGATLTGLSISNGMVSFVITNLSSSATNYVLRCHDLVAPVWTTSHIFTGVSGQINWSEAISNGWQKVFYQTLSE